MMVPTRESSRTNLADDRRIALGAVVRAVGQCDRAGGIRACRTLISRRPGAGPSLQRPAHTFLALTTRGSPSPTS